MARIATIFIVIDQDTDAGACDFLSETLNGMPYVIDWAHADVPEDPQLGDYTIPYDVPDDYHEGLFLKDVVPD